MGNLRATAAAAYALALTACPSVDLGDTPSDISACYPAKGMAYFTSDIEPRYLQLGDPAGCARTSMCHDAGGHAPVLDRIDPIDHATNFKAVQLKLDCGSPMASPLFTKPLAGVDGHGGGDLFDINDPKVQVFLAWFQQ